MQTLLKKVSHCMTGNRILSLTRWLWLWLVAFGLAACGLIPPHVLTTPNNPVPVAEYFPNALLAEPIMLREGFTHTTQPFSIKGPQERWSVEVGYVRNDQNLTLAESKKAGHIFCFADGLLDALYDPVRYECKKSSPGLNVRWELLRADNRVVHTYYYDSLKSPALGKTTSKNAITIVLSGFTNLPAGQYQLRVTVLRDFSELDFAKPHILINRPFFSRQF